MLILLFPKFGIKNGVGKDAVNSTLCVYFLSLDKEDSLYIEAMSTAVVGLGRVLLTIELLTDISIG